MVDRKIMDVWGDSDLGAYETLEAPTRTLQEMTAIIKKEVSPVDNGDSSLPSITSNPTTSVPASTAIGQVQQHSSTACGRTIDIDTIIDKTDRSKSLYTAVEKKSCNVSESETSSGSLAPYLLSESKRNRYDSSSCPNPDSPEANFCTSTTQCNNDLTHSMLQGSMKEEGDGPRRLCLVCGDMASGFHYGVASCEACKAFFKRTIQGNIEYTCPATNDCEINKRRRKACQSCRFLKCVRMGMLKEGVRLDRVRGGRQKYRRNSDMPYPTCTTSPKKHSLDDNKMMQTLTANEPEVHSINIPDPTLIEPQYRTASILSDLYDREIISVIGWAKQVPGFTELTLNDQMRLLQSTWTEILTFSIAFRSLSTPGKLLFAADFSMDEKQAKEAGTFDLYHPVVERLDRVGIMKEEYCLMKALILVNADARIEEFTSVKRLRETILMALCDCVAALRPTTAYTQVNSLLLCLPILRQSDLAIKKFWLSVRREGKISMNKLFVEMLEAHFR